MCIRDSSWGASGFARRRRIFCCSLPLTPPFRGACAIVPYQHPPNGFTLFLSCDVSACGSFARRRSASGGRPGQGLAAGGLRLSPVRKPGVAEVRAACAPHNIRIYGGSRVWEALIPCVIPKVYNRFVSGWCANNSASPRYTCLCH